MPGPGVLLQFLNRLRCEGNWLPVILGAHLSGEVLHQFRNVFFSLPQRRQQDGKNVNPVKEVLAELALPHQGLQIAMGSHHHSHIYLGRLVAADALDFAFLQYAQQFGLHGQRHVADFVEKNRSPLGLLEFADMAPGGPVNEPFS